MTRLSDLYVEWFVKSQHANKARLSLLKENVNYAQNGLDPVKMDEFVDLMFVDVKRG